MTAGLQEIGAVARELGVAPSTLRTWERRYRLVVPHRGDHGQRLYDSDQIVTLRRVLAQLRRGARARAAHDLAVIPKATRVARVRFEPTPGAPALARRAIDELLGDDGDTRFGFYLRLVASELVKNAVLYGSDREAIRMETKLFPDWAELRVQNGGEAVEHAQAAHPPARRRPRPRDRRCAGGCVVDRHGPARHQDHGSAARRAGCLEPPVQTIVVAVIPGSGSGSFGSICSSVLTRISATARLRDQLWSAGTTYHGAYSVDVMCSASS